MKYKTVKIIYRILIALFVLAMLADGFGGISRQQAGVDALKHLGYPVYVLSIVGIAKILGAAAVLQNKYKTIKEWAFSGFVINCIGACLSHIFIGDAAGITIAPCILLSFTFLLYYFWKKYNTLTIINI